MHEKLYETDRGQIHYWVSEPTPKDELTLVFLPGLTADHRLFEKQIEHFEGRYPLLVWDAPGHGYRMLADALSADPPHTLPCPALLLCGEKDRAGSCLRYNKAWHKRAGIPLHFIPGAGHNANTDAPEIVNTYIQQFLEELKR